MAKSTVIDEEVSLVEEITKDDFETLFEGSVLVMSASEPD
jgi:hypothetical protein